MLLSLLTGKSAMQLYFMALTPPMQQFVLHSQLTTSMTAWGIGSKVIMTGIGLSPSYLTPTKMPLINNWHPSLMKWFETWWLFPHASDIPAGCSFNNHYIISSDCRLASCGWLHLHCTCVIIRIWAIEIPSLTHHDIMVDIVKMVLVGPCNPKFSVS